MIENFWATAWSKFEHCIIVDEAALTIKRDRNIMPAFTMMNKRKHKFIVIGHDGTDLLPGMRHQFDHIFLFLQSPQAVENWENEFTDRHLPGDVHIADAASLKMYQFIAKDRFHPAQKFQLTK